MFNPRRSVRPVWLTQATDRLFKYVCICQSSSGTLVVEAEVGVGATVRVMNLKMSTLRSKRFRGVEEQRKTEERDFWCFAHAKNEARAKKRRERGGEGAGEGRKCLQTL